MPTKIHIIRHAQGEHNLTHNYTIRDAVLTPKGKEQCRALSSVFPHKDINIVFASPLRRTIQTAALSLGPALARKDVQFVLHPLLQEVGDMGSDTGIADTADDLKNLLPELFAKDDLKFDIAKVDAGLVTKGWNVKGQGYYAYQKPAISKRAADFRNWLYQRPEAEVVLVTHGAIAHFLTEDWDVEDPMIGTAYKNCEHRDFVFTADSTVEDAHVVETVESKARRGPKGPESDPHVLDEMKTVQAQAKKENQQS